MDEAARERRRQQSNAYAARNRDVIREKNNAHYKANRDEILARRRERQKKVNCKLCHFDFCNNYYLKKHLCGRHKLSPQDAVRIITS